MVQSLVANYKSFIEQVLTPKRLQHSLGVMRVMEELVKIYQLDCEKALLAGLLHDAGKDLPLEQYMRIVEHARIQIRHECDRDYLHYLHGPVGAYFVKQELGIHDPSILDAIATHTYYGEGEYFNAPLTWCLRFADILEAGRDWSKVRWLHAGVARLRATVYAGRLLEGAYLQTSWLVLWFEEQGVLVHPNMRQVKGELAAQLILDDTFLL